MHLSYLFFHNKSFHKKELYKHHYNLMDQNHHKNIDIPIFFLEYSPYLNIYM